MGKRRGYAPKGRGGRRKFGGKGIELCGLLLFCGEERLLEG